ncbi:MAG: thioredoxin-dependent thiol peroxidase [Phycisphaerales bacterium JB060]
MPTTTDGPVKPGRKAPAFKLKDQDGNSHALSDYAGRPVVLFFYPKDDTSGCTQEACDFRDQLPAFEKLGVAVLGISILGTKSKAKFASKNELTFPLLADDRENDVGKPDPAIAQKYGVWVEKSMYGRTYMGIERTTFLIDAQGKIARVWSKVKVPGHVDDVADAVKELV